MALGAASHDLVFKYRCSSSSEQHHHAAGVKPALWRPHGALWSWGPGGVGPRIAAINPGASVSGSARGRKRCYWQAAGSPLERRA